LVTFGGHPPAAEFTVETRTLKDLNNVCLTILIKKANHSSMIGADSFQRVF